MSLPFSNIVVFIYSFYALIAISVLVVYSINQAFKVFKRGIDNA